MFWCCLDDIWAMLGCCVNELLMTFQALPKKHKLLEVLHIYSVVCWFSWQYSFSWDHCIHCKIWFVIPRGHFCENVCPPPAWMLSGPDGRIKYFRTNDQRKSLSISCICNWASLALWTSLEAKTIMHRLKKYARLAHINATCLEKLRRPKTSNYILDIYIFVMFDIC